MTWPITKLDQIAEAIDYGHTASSTMQVVGPKFLRITDIQEGRVCWNSVPFCECSSVEQERYALRRGDIVFARTGATTGKSFLIRECPDGAVFASYLIRVRPSKAVDSGYLAHFFDTPFYWQQITKSATGSTQPGVNSTKLKELDVPLPSLSEQKRIAGILDQADGLRRKRQQAVCHATNLIQSILFDFTGQAINAAVRPLFHNTSKCLPCDFVWRRLDEVTHSVQDIDHNMPKSVLAGVPFISAKDLTDDGELSFADVKCISRDDYLRLSRKVKPQRGDVIYSRIGARLGKARLVKVDFEFLASYSCCTIRPDTRLIDPVFLTIYLDSIITRRQANLDTRSIAVPDLGLEKIKDFLVPVTSIERQQQFVQEVGLVQKIVDRMKTAAKDMDALFNSLVQRAFRGEL